MYNIFLYSAQSREGKDHYPCNCHRKRETGVQRKWFDLSFSNLLRMSLLTWQFLHTPPTSTHKNVLGTPIKHLESETKEMHLRTYIWLKSMESLLSYAVELRKSYVYVYLMYYLLQRQMTEQNSSQFSRKDRDL